MTAAHSEAVSPSSSSSSSSDLMARNIGRLFPRLCSLRCSVPAVRPPRPGAAVRNLTVAPPPSKFTDHSLPNSSWTSETMGLYEHYNSQCEVVTEGGEKRPGPWRRLSSYICDIKDMDDAGYLHNNMISKARLFTHIGDQGSAFEYAVFVNKDELKCVGIFQPGYLLEGPPGHVHGGAIATMVDNVTWNNAYLLSQPEAIVTVNLNINYRSPIPLGSTVLIESSVEKKEGRKTLVSCKVTDGSHLYTDATALFVLINVGQVLGVH